MLADVTTSRYTVVSWELPTYSKDLVNYQLFYRAIGSPIQTVIYNLSTNVSNYYISELHPAITYAISVQGMYKNDVQGLHAELLVTTLEEGKTVELNDTATNIVLGCPPNQNCMAGYFVCQQRWSPHTLITLSLFFLQQLHLLLQTY